MRLTEDDRRRIVQLTAEVVGSDARVLLFGSRVDDARRGGDIDLLVTLPRPVDRPALLAAELGARLERALGERRIDIVLDAPNLRPQPIHAVAHAQGVSL